MPLSNSDLDRDAIGLAALIRAGQIKPLELIDAVIARIERTHSQLNAVNTPMFELAREAARQPLSEGPFAGVPFLLKDIRASFAGVPTSSGSRGLKNYVPTYDSELIRRYKSAGLICVGKTNTPELGLTATTEPHAFGASHNPWDLERTPGGSSGGSAAAVAARIVPAAHSSDGGGSIRIPASCCGLVGLKPTRGRNPMGPDIGDAMGGLVNEHVVSLSIRDSAALLDAGAGPDIGDPYFAPPTKRPFLDEVGVDPGNMRIAFSTASPVDGPVDHDCVAAVEHAAELLARLGHKVEEGRPQYDDPAFREAFTTIWFSGLASSIARHPALIRREVTEADYEPLTWKIRARGAAIPATDYLIAVGVIQGIARKVASFFEEYDFWLTPTLSSPAPKLGYLHPGPDAQDLRPYSQRVRDFCPFTQLANATGQPAISLPLHWNDDGLPIGVHFMARFGGEAKLIRLASQLEQAQPWFDRKPPVCAL